MFFVVHFVSSWFSVRAFVCLCKTVYVSSAFCTMDTRGLGQWRQIHVESPPIANSLYAQCLSPMSKYCVRVQATKGVTAVSWCWVKRCSCSFFIICNYGRLRADGPSSSHIKDNDTVAQQKKYQLGNMPRWCYGDISDARNITLWDHSGSDWAPWYWHFS